MKRNYRQGRMGEEIRKIISGMLLREIKDPRLSGMVSITAVEVTSDGSYATIYVSAGGDPGKRGDALAAFGSAKGLIKKAIGKQMMLRHVPELIFKEDNSMEYGRHITEIIDRLDIKHDDLDEGENEEE